MTLTRKVKSKIHNKFRPYVVIMETSAIFMLHMLLFQCFVVTTILTHWVTDAIVAGDIFETVILASLTHLTSHTV